MYIKLHKYSEIQSDKFSKASYKVNMFDTPMICSKYQIDNILKAYPGGYSLFHGNGCVDIYFNVSASTKCNELDEFDELKGRDQAENKAIKKAYKQARVIIDAMRRANNKNDSVIEEFDQMVSDKFYNRTKFDLA